MACLHENGLYEVFDRSGRTLAFTHGHDPVPDLAESHIPPSAVALRCTDPAFRPYHVRLIVAQPSTGATVSISNAQLITLAEQANGAYHESASRFGRYRSLWTVCNGDTPIVQRVTLPTPMAQTTFSTVQEDLESLGFNDRRVKYWVFFAGHPPGSPGGTGAVEMDDRLSTANGNNGNAGRIHVSVTWGYHSWAIMAHELGHNLGAVQNSSPNSSGAFHCNDGFDVMCYADGGPRSNYRTSVCSLDRIDCKNDDYFHPVPPAGSYLATRWNLADPVVRYFLGCFDGTGFLRAGAPGVQSEGVTRHTFELPTHCAGQSRFVLEAYPPITGLVGVTYQVDVCFYAAAGFQLSCTSGLGHLKTGDVPDDAASARVFATRGVDIHYDLRLG